MLFFGKFYVTSAKRAKENCDSVSRLAISDKKNYSAEDGIDGFWFVPAEFRLFRGTENSRNSVPKHSAEEKKVRNSVPWNKNRSKLSGFPSKPFRGRETNSEFRSEACLGQKHAVNYGCWSRIFF
jgi:hypothetical protein